MKGENKISEILYDQDGNKKPFYILSSERDIKETRNLMNKLKKEKVWIYQN